MNYREWMLRVPQEFTDDTLWRMEVYRLALFAGDVAWADVSRLIQDRRTVDLAGQLYDAMGSMSANIIRQMLVIIPTERGQSLREEPPPYLTLALNTAIETLLQTIPMSEQPLDAPRTTQHSSHA